MIVNTLWGHEEIQDVKICNKCNEEKLFTEFHYRNHTKDGKLVYFNICKDCKQLHDQAKIIIEKTYSKPNKNYICPICKETEKSIEEKYGQHGKKGHKQMSLWQMDIDHKDYSFRNYLCAHCNTMISRSHDDPEILRNGADYLEKHN